MAVKRIQGAREPTFEAGARSGADLLAALAQELIGAAGPEVGAPLIEQAARQIFGVAGLALLYTAMPNTPKGITLRCAPIGAKSWVDEDLARRVIALRAEAQNADGEVCAHPLSVRRPGLAAVLYRVPGGGAASAQRNQYWRAFLDLVTKWLSAQLEQRRLRTSLRRLERAERLQRALYAIADLASSELEMPDMLREVHQIVGELMYAENFYIVLRDTGRGTLRFIYFADTQDQEVPDPAQEFVEREIPNSLTAALLRYGRPLMGPSEEIRCLLYTSPSPRDS